MERILRPLLIIVGLALALVAYFWVHKPFDPLLALSLAGLGLDVLTVIVFLTLTGGFGRYLLHLTGYTPDTVYEHMTFASGLGLGAFSIIALVLGLLGLFQNFILWGVLILLAVWSRKQVVLWVDDLRFTVFSGLRAETPFTRFLAVFVWIALITSLLVALAPPLGWDSLTYHLVGPQTYLKEGQISAHADNFYLGFTQGVEMLYSTLMGAFGRDTAAAPLHWWYAVLTVITLGSVVRRYTDRLSGWIAVVIPLASLSIWVLMGYAYVDLGVMTYAALALVALLRWWEREDSVALLLCGVYIGMAMSIKYPGGVLAFGAMLVIMLRYHEDWRISLKACAKVTIIAGAIFLPWAVKGMLLYENPVYPFFLNGLGWDAFRTDYFNPPETGLVARGEGWHIPIIPLAATVFGVEKGDGYAFTTGLWLFPAGLFLVAVGRLSPAKGIFRVIILYALPALLYWMLTASYFEVNMQVRLMTMLFPSFTLLSAFGLDAVRRLPEKPLDVGFIVQAVFILMILLSLLDILKETEKTQVLAYHVSGNFTRDDYILNNGLQHGSYHAYQEIAALVESGEIPAGSRIRLMWEPKGYYCPQEVTCQADELLDHWRHQIDLGRSPQAILAEWREVGEDYILIWEAGLDFFIDFQPERMPGADLFRPLLLTEASAIWQDEAGEYKLYTWQVDGE